MRRIVLVVSGVALGLALVNPAVTAVRAQQVQDPAVLDPVMKSVGSTFGAARKAVEAGDMAAAKTGAETMSKAFVETEAFFKSHGTDRWRRMGASGQEGRRRHRRPPHRPTRPRLRPASWASCAPAATPSTASAPPTVPTTTRQVPSGTWPGLGAWDWGLALDKADAPRFSVTFEKAREQSRAFFSWALMLL